jgi:AcrR family transcriptional regulator
VAKKSTNRTPLSKNTVLQAAVRLADELGLATLSMRRLGQALGVEAMSLYNHVANKDEILDGIVELVVGEIRLPVPGEEWKEAMRNRAISAREMLLRHPWATGIMESRTNPGPVTLRYYDRVIGCLRHADFSIAMAAHAFSVLDSYIYGFALQHSKLPFETPEELAVVAEHILKELPVDQFPHLFEMTTEHVLQPGYNFADEFLLGLDLILNGLERTASSSI